MLHIVMICGCGMGSNVILKVNAGKAFKGLDIETRLEVNDIMTGKGAARTADLVLIGRKPAYLVQNIDKPIIQFTSFVNKQEIKDELRRYREANGIKQKLQELWEQFMIKRGIGHGRTWE